MKKVRGIGLYSALLLFGVVLLGSTTWVFYVIPEFVTSAVIVRAQQSAESTVKQFKIIRRYYSDSVVAKAINGGVDVVADHHLSEKAIPLPATFIHDLSQELSDEGTKIHLYSGYPFPHRRKDRHLDDFQKNAWNYLRTNPDKTFHSHDVLNGRQVIRMALPEKMSVVSCIQCHNTHEDSPKRDWRIGDVRGVLEVIMDIEEPIAEGVSLGNKILLSVFGILLLLVSIVGVSSHLLVRNRNAKLSLILHSLHRLSAGEYSRQLPPQGGMFGEIIDAINSLNEEFKDTVERLGMERQRAEVALQEMHHYQSVIDTHAIVATTDLRGDITFANKKFCELSQYTEEELIGKNHRIIKSEVHSKEFWTELWKIISKGGMWQGEVCNKAKDGSHYWVKATIAPLFGPDKKINGYIAVRTDITERKRIEKDLNVAIQRAEQAVAAKSAFLATMSHEIRTPMNSIIGFTRVLLRKTNDFTEQQAELLQRVNNAADNLLRIINNILDFSRMENGKLVLFRLRAKIKLK